MTRATKQLLEQTKKRRLKNTVKSRGIIEADSRVEIQEWVWSSDAFRIKAVLGEPFECISSSGRKGGRVEGGADEEASLGLSRGYSWSRGSIVIEPLRVNRSYTFDNRVRMYLDRDTY